MKFLNIRQVICKIAFRWDFKSQDFSNLHFVGKLGPKINIKKNHNIGTAQVINIKLVSLKSDPPPPPPKKKKKQQKQQQQTIATI